jgi:hypothetical protein
MFFVEKHVVGGSMEKHSDSERSEKFSGKRFLRRHLVRSLASARKWEKHYHERGFHVRIEKEGPGRYGVYTRKAERK